MDFNSDYLATARARVGYADDNLLFYATAGLAFVDAELDNTANARLSSTRRGRPRQLIDTRPRKGEGCQPSGGAAGLGMEWGITQNLSAKVDGLFLFFDDATGIETSATRATAETSSRSTTDSSCASAPTGGSIPSTGISATRPHM